MAKGGFPRGMSGGANMNQMMKMQEELENKTYESASGGGAVKVVFDGKRELKEVTISPEVVDADDVEMLQDLIIAAVNEGLRQIEEDSTSQLGSITGGLNIPGLF